MILRQAFKICSLTDRPESRSNKRSPIATSLMKSSGWCERSTAYNKCRRASLLPHLVHFPNKPRSIPCTVTDPCCKVSLETSVFGHHVSHQSHGRNLFIRLGLWRNRGCGFFDLGKLCLDTYSLISGT